MAPFKAFVVALLFASVGMGRAQTAREYTWKIAGSEVGKTTVTTEVDGSFRSDTRLSVATIQVQSELTGRIEGGKLVAYKLVQGTPGKQTGTFEGKDGAYTVVVDGKEVDHGKFEALSAYFSNYHPSATGSICAAFDPKGQASQKLPVYAVEGSRALNLETVKLASRTVKVAAGSVVVAVFRLRLPGVDVDVFLDPTGAVVGWLVPSQRLEVIAKGFENLVVDPTTAYKELSQPTMAATIEKGVTIPMRDKVSLAADVARPAGAGKYPAILVRTPYGRDASFIEGEWWAKRGYAFVSQDVRGRGDSKGVFTPFLNERKDGVDTIAWVAKQPWCNGKVGMIGGSYLGMVQWQAAVERPPALKCIVPQVAPPDLFYNFPYDHGIPMLASAVWWGRVVLDKAGMQAAFNPIERMEGFLKLPLPVIENAVLGYNVPFIDDWWKRDTNRAFASANYMGDLDRVDIPALLISGWFDGDGIGTKLVYARLRELGKKNRYLVYGPWTHLFNTTTRLGDVDFGPSAIKELNSVYLRWFDTWLKGKAVLAALPRVQVFVTGENVWRSLDDWPPDKSVNQTLFLAKGGTLAGAKPRPGTEAYVYDPSTKKIEKTTMEIGPGQGTTVMAPDKNDKGHLFYQSAPLTAPKTVVGPLAVDVTFSTNVVDTDFFAVVLDVDAKGVRRVVGLPGKLRAMYREGMDKRVPLKPGKTYTITLEPWDIAHRFDKGHRIAIMLRSEMFPGYARNLNTGEPVATGTRMVPATQTIRYGGAKPSAFRFRVLK
ncbi:MAG: CocE/NonD family hydrolase [Fimbriimonadaceae bacterium]|nr:CocE/NonD family hydrolase [Fimbriimonadaceae bacterium]